MIELRVLGSLELRGPEGEALLPVLAQPKRAALLAYLALAAPRGFHRRDQLLGLFWADRDQEHARASLRKALHFLRQNLGEQIVVNRGDGEVGLAEAEFWCDAIAFERALEDGDFKTAVSLYSGPLLDAFHVGDSAELERWIDAERRRLADLYADALEELAEQAEAARDYRQAGHCWRQLTAHDAFNSRYVARLMEALVAAGDPANALQCAEEHERLLKDELGAEPGPEVRNLCERLRQGASEGAEVARTPAILRTLAKKAAGTRAQTGRARLAKALAIYAVAAFAVLVTAHILTLQLGLPDWFFISAVVLLFASLPIVVVTALLVSVPGVRGHVKWQRTIVAIVSVFALLGVGVSGYMAMRVLGIGPWGTLIGTGVLEPQDLVVLAEFEDHAGDPVLAHMVTDLIRLKLEGSPVVKVASRAYVRAGLQRMARDSGEPVGTEVARELATREGLKAVVVGAVHLTGANYVVSARLVAAQTGEVLDSFRESAKGPDAIIAATDQLSDRLREKIGESLRTIRSSPPLKQVRTPSLEALRLYTEGVHANIRLREFRRACDLASRAIAIDTLFVAAYRLRAHCHTNLGINRAQIIADATRAYELRHLLTPKERYNSEAVYHQMVTGDLEALIHAWGMVLEIDPNWSTAYNQIGGAYYTLRDYVRAEEMFRRRLELSSLAGISLGGLARSQFNQGKFDEANETLREWERGLPGHPDIALKRAAFASARGGYPAAEAQLRSVVARQPESFWHRARAIRHLGYLALLQGKFVDAEIHLREAMESVEEYVPPATCLAPGIELAGMRAWLLGDTAGALETVAAALERHPLESIHPLERPYSALAGFYAFAGAPARTREILARWEAAVPADLRRRQEVSRRLAWAAVAMAEGRAEDALADLRFVQERDRCPICQLPLIGRIYESLAQEDSALAAYERYLTTPYAERSLPTPYSVRPLGGMSPADGYDPYWLPVVYERLGALYKRRGDAANAARYYGKLVELWKDADPELQPRVDAARRAIAALSIEKREMESATGPAARLQNP